MPKLLRKFLGLTLLVTTIGLTTCQSMLKAEPLNQESLPDSICAAHVIEATYR